jgi:hypothetical protein
MLRNIKLKLKLILGMPMYVWFIIYRIIEFGVLKEGLPSELIFER